jgi:hydroxymethylglutaryl-CoA reductase (NADPH)
MPYLEAPSFLSASQEIPVSSDASQVRYLDDGTSVEEKKWIMKAVKNSDGNGSVRRWAKNAWTDFLDLLKASILYETLNDNL